MNVVRHQNQREPEDHREFQKPQKRAEHPAHFDQPPERPESKEESVDQAMPDQSVQGFVEYLSKKKPFIGGIFKNLELQMDGEKITLALDKNYTFIKEDMNLREEVRQHMKLFLAGRWALP